MNKREDLRKRYPEGTRIRLIHMGPDPRPVPPGTLGTVKGIDGDGGIRMCWDNGRTLKLIEEEDDFVVIPKEQEEQ